MDAGRTLPTVCQLGSLGGVKLWGRSSGFVLGHSSPVKGYVYVSRCHKVLDSAMLLALRQQFGEGPFLF